MRVLLAVASSLLLAHVARGESFTVRIQETAVIAIDGATAAYTTNPAIADAIIGADGRLTITGHSAGTTQLVAITTRGTQSFLVTVASPPPSATRPEAGVPVARYEGRYTSAAGRVSNTIDVVTSDGRPRSEIHILHAHDLRAPTGQPSDTLASIYYRRITAGRQVTLLDDLVDVSRMTVSNTQIRGLHLRQGPLELHAGYASSTFYDGFFLPTERRWVGGGSYSIDSGSTRWTPSLYAFFSEPAGTAARRGVVAALTAKHHRGEALSLHGELGVSRSSVAGSGEIRYVSPRHQFRGFLSVKPDDFPTLGLSDMRGSHVALDWTNRTTDRLSITSYGTLDRFNLGATAQTMGVASLGLRYVVTSRLEVTGGADLSLVRTPSSSIRTLGLPLGVSYDAPSFGVAASYRLLSTSTASRRGDALRLNARAGRGRFAASVWGERQRHAPTLELIFADDPGLELALLRLGISFRTPEDVARALRDNAALIDLGFITGVNVDLTPRRLQAGFSLAWLGSGGGNHLRFLAVFGRDEGIRTTRDHLLATLTYSRRVLSATDVYTSLSAWRAGAPSHHQTGTSLEIGLRQQFVGLPRFLQRGGTIEGFVFLDPERRGVRGANTQPLHDVVVTLDGNRTARTDSRGAYAFQDVAPGSHRIAAQLPASPRAFFTTASQSQTKAPAHVDFGLVWAAARIDGRVISDAGAGIAGVLLSASAQNAAPAGNNVTATTDIEGRFVFAVPPGTFRINLTAESLPDGFLIAGRHDRVVAVEADQPKSISFVVSALRSVAGRATGASEARIESLQRTVPVDAEGNFVFRSMPQGTFTITAGSGGRIVTGSVTLPAGPSMIRDVVLGFPSPLR